jgi:hypothetical protein
VDGQCECQGIDDYEAAVEPGNNPADIHRRW